MPRTGIGGIVFGEVRGSSALRSPKNRFLALCGIAALLGRRVERLEREGGEVEPLVGAQVIEPGGDSGDVGAIVAVAGLRAAQAGRCVQCEGDPQSEDRI